MKIHNLRIHVNEDKQRWANLKKLFNIVCDFKKGIINLV